MNLATADLRMLLDLTGYLHQPSADSLVKRPEVVQGLSALLHVDIVGCHVWSDQGRRLEEPGVWGCDERMNADYQAYFHKVDPISPLLRSRPEPVLIDTLIERKALQRTEYFTDFLSLHSVYPGLSMYLEDEDGMLVDYRLGTSDPKKRFGNREVVLLDLLRPHLFNAQRLRRVSGANSEDDDDISAYPAFILERARPPRPNRKASELLAGLESPERDALLGALCCAPRAAPAGLQWNGFNVCVERLPRAQAGGAAYRAYLVAHTVGSASWFQQTFDVTLREAEVCHLMFKGLSDKQIALALGISYWTVRIHVGRILEKLGIDSRAAIGQAVLKASRGARGN